MRSLPGFHPSSCFPIIPNKNPDTAPKGGVQCRRIFDCGAIFGWILTAERVPQNVAAHLVTLSASPAVLCALIPGGLLAVGTFMETSAALIILTPLFLPVVR